MEPEVFAGSVIADVGIPSVEAVRDSVSGNWKPVMVKAIGLENPEAVSPTLGDNVPDEVKRQVEDLREKIVNDEIEVSTEYVGPEMAL